MRAVAALLVGLPLQPEETGDILDAKSQLFQKSVLVAYLLVLFDWFRLKMFRVSFCF